MDQEHSTNLSTLALSFIAIEKWWYCLETRMQTVGCEAFIMSLCTQNANIKHFPQHSVILEKRLCFELCQRHPLHINITNTSPKTCCVSSDPLPKAHPSQHLRKNAPVESFPVSNTLHPYTDLQPSSWIDKGMSRTWAAAISESCLVMMDDNGRSIHKKNRSDFSNATWCTCLYST